MNLNNLRQIQVKRQFKFESLNGLTFPVRPNTVDSQAIKTDELVAAVQII